MNYDRIHQVFAFAEPLRYHSEEDVPALECHWIPSSWMKPLNSFIKRFFHVTKQREESCIKTWTIDTKVVTDAILESQDRIEMIYNHRCRGVIVGPRQMKQLASECYMHQFSVRIPLGGPQGYQVFNLPVEVIPWLDGVVLLPQKR